MLCLLFIFSGFLLLSSCDTVEKNPKANESEALIKKMEREIGELENINNRLKNRNSKLTTKISRLEDKFNEAYKEYSNEHFDQFVRKFSNDSIFQLSRIKFPLDYVTWKTLSDGQPDWYGEIDTMKITANEWRHRDLTIFHSAFLAKEVYDNFDMKLRPTNERVVHIFVYETGVTTKYFLKAIEGKWFLVKVIDLSD